MPEERPPIFAEVFNQKLKERGYTLERLSEATGISLKHLESFAHGRFEQLPPIPYLRGYFMKLGALLGFDAEAWWEQVKHDEDVQRSGKLDRLPRNRFGFSGNNKSSRTLFGLGAVILVVLLYFGFRASSILGVPDLTVLEPSGDARVSEGYLLVMGTVENASEVIINDIQVPIENGNEFRRSISLDPGMNTIVVTAKKTLGRTAVVTRQIFYDASPVQIILEEGLNATSSNATSTENASTTP
jgi:transcriptional regulator with XRE-family HTH domain